ncbi:MAG: formyltetrahydrofolate deformylase [Smithellaceae bacterium]|jgi:hypothetical protein
MALINESNAHENWFDVLALWNRIANWIHYQTSETELRQQFKSMLVYLWSEKDWLQCQYPTKAKKIEQAIDASKYMGIVGDLANTVKHRNLTRHRRTAATQTNYYGKVTVSKGVERRMYYISIGSGKHEEIMTVLRGALDEFKKLRHGLLSGSL